MKSSTSEITLFCVVDGQVSGGDETLNEKLFAKDKQSRTFNKGQEREIARIETLMSRSLVKANDNDKE